MRWVWLAVGVFAGTIVGARAASADINGADGGSDAGDAGADGPTADAATADAGALADAAPTDDGGGDASTGDGGIACDPAGDPPDDHGVCRSHLGGCSLGGTGAGAPFGLGLVLACAAVAATRRRGDAVTRASR